MKKVQSYEQFVEQLKDESIPEINLVKLKDNISKLDAVKKASGYKRKLIAVVAAVILVMCLGTVVMAYYNGWQLKNKGGDVVYSYSKLENSELFKWWDASRVESDYEIIREEALESLASGEMAYFLVTEAYKLDGVYSILQKEENIYDLDMLRKSTKTKFKAPQYLPGSYRFEYGSIIYKAEGEEEKEKELLYKTAIDTGQPYILKKGKLTKEAKSVMLKYVNDDGYKLTIRIGEWDRDRSLDVEIETIEKLSIADKEVLYMKHNWYNTDSYVFVDDNSSEKLTYVISNYDRISQWDNSGMSMELDKEEAAKMIKSFE